MSFKNERKPCQQCGKTLTLASQRDLDRKKFCSHSCRQKYRYKQGDRPVSSGRPKGSVQTYARVMVCELCSDEVDNAHPLQRWCEECVPDSTWRHRARRYAIGKKQWEALLEEQGGHCALCSAEPEVVDHDHETGRVRGLLCGSCNLRLSGLDDREWLVKALAYARRA